MELKNRLTGAVVTASLLLSLGGVGTVHAATSAEDTRIAFGAAAARENGRAIAEAILFGSGLHAKAVASIQALALSQEVAEANESTEAQETITALLDMIEKNDPDIYKTVHAGLRSGDPYSAEVAMNRLSDSARSAIVEYSESVVGEQGLADVTPNRAVVVIVAAVHVLTVVTAGNAAVFVNAVAGANLFWNRSWGSSDAPGERPAELIADLTEAFAD